MWCEKSIQHHPTSPPSCKWGPGIFWGANYLAIFHIPALVQVGLRVPTPLSGRDGQSSCELLALLQEFASIGSECLLNAQAAPLSGSNSSNIICNLLCDRSYTHHFQRELPFFQILSHTPFSPLPLTCAVEGRRSLLDINLKEVSLSPDLDLDDIAKLSEGYSGADITNLCRLVELMQWKLWTASMGLEAEILEKFWPFLI